MNSWTSPLQLAVLISIAAAFPALAQPKIPPKYKASPLEVAQLPTYCYQQYVDGSLGGFKFSIPDQSCGPAMNHYCPALVFMIQAQRQSLPKNERVGAMGHAIKEINYTIRDMKPGCFIAKDVFDAKKRAEAMAPFIR